MCANRDAIIFQATSYWAVLYFLSFVSSILRHSGCFIYYLWYYMESDGVTRGL